ncbi:MAG: DUF945 family protein [Gammaproteobacteria bacterium]
MRAKFIGAGLLFVFILVFMIGLPWMVGQKFKTHYYNFISALQTDKRIQAKVLEYHEGWFSSDAKLSISPVAAVASPNSPRSAYASQVIILDQHIYHGPVIHDTQKASWVIGLALIQSKVHLPSEVEALLLGNNPQSRGIVEVHTLATFNNDYLTEIETPIFNVQIPNVGEFDWQGLSGYMNFQVKGKHLIHVVTELNIGAISARTNAGSLKTKNVLMKYDMTPDPTGLWSGTSSCVAPEVALVSKNDSFTLQNLNFTDVFGVNAGKMYTSVLQFSLSQMIIPNFLINQSSLNFSFENLNALELGIFIKKAGDLQNHREKITADQFQQFTALIPPIIAPTTMFKQNMTINTSNGRMLSNGQANWPTVVKTMDDVVKGVKANLSLRVSISLVNRVIDLIAAQAVPITPAVSPTVAPAVPTEQSLLKDIDVWAKSNKVDLSIGIQLKDLVQAHLSVADFSRNVDRFVTLKELTPELASQIKTQYADINTVKTVSVLAQPQLIEPIQISPADQTKQQLAQFVSQGFVKQDNDDYVASLTFEQGVLKANGLEVTRME